MRTPYRGLLLFLLTLVLAVGCATGVQPVMDQTSTPAPAQPAETEAAAVQEAFPAWSIALNGAFETVFSSDQLIGSSGSPAHTQNVSVEVKGEMRTYTGIPLYMVLAMVDSEEEEHPYTFSWDLWEAGYDVTFTASDGYSVTVSSADCDAENSIIAYREDGEYISPMLVGPGLSRSQWVKDLASIELALETAAEIVPALTFTGADTQITFTAAELKETAYYMEGTGGFTTSAGTYYENVYGGVALYDLISSFGTISDTGKVTAVASDGYEMSYSVSDLKDTSSGTWIAAFEQDGAPIEFDPGYFRIVKIGDPVPNIDGHSSAKMVAEIRFTAEPFTNFELVMTGRKDAVIDRATIESAINCTAHSRETVYLNRKSGELEYYRGIPLFALLAFSDDPDYAPHKQTDHDILAYDAAAAETGYTVRVTAADGFSVDLDSRELHNNYDVIIAMYRDGSELDSDEGPLKLVWDHRAETVPAGIKAVRQVARIDLLF
jgi:hypothetical protein